MEKPRIITPDEDARFETAEERHSRFQDEEKNNIVKRVFALSHEHFIGEVIAKQHREDFNKFRNAFWASLGMPPCWTEDYLVGRYFTTNGEATTFYIIMQKYYERRHPRDRSHDSDIQTHTGLCFEEENPLFLENIVRSANDGKLCMNVGCGTIMGTRPKNRVFSFGSENTANRNQGIHCPDRNYYLSGINIEKKEYEELIISLTRDTK